MSLYTHAANSDKTFLDADFNPTEDMNDAKYYRTVTPETFSYFTKVFHLNDIIRMEEQYSDSDLIILHGTCSYYYQNGQLESSGMFQNGKKIGSWRRYLPDGNAKPDHYYASPEELKLLQRSKDSLAKFDVSKQSWASFLNKTLKFPAKAKCAGIQSADVHVNLQLSATGELTHFEILECAHQALYIETIKLMAHMPDWLPAYKSGRQVSSNYIVKIPFNENTPSEVANHNLILY